MGPTVLRKRDLAILAIISIGAFISFDTTNNFSYIFEPAWYIDQRKTGWTAEWALIPPIITDLDGNGEKEMILVTRDLQLKVLSAAPPENDKTAIYVPNEIASVRLSSLNVLQGAIPVALKTGYVEPYDPNKERKQVIVVVREDFTVTVYDTALKVLWEKAVAHKAHEMEKISSLFVIHEVSIHLSPLSIKEGSTGLVTVGASMRLRDEDVEKFVKLQDGLDLDESGDKEHPGMRLRSKLEHFSVYAMDAADGVILWRHDGVEVHAEQYVKSLPQHAYKLDLTDLASKIHHAPGINDWSVFRQSLIEELPHSWRIREDTSLRIAHFVRRHMGAGAGAGGIRNKNSQNVGPVSDHSVGERKAKTVNRDVGRFTGVETPPLSETASLPHDSEEHMQNPNVLVAHTQKGVEVIALRTGMPITSLALAAGNSYADIDGDGIVDSIILLENEHDVASHGSAFAYDSGEFRHCSIMVISGLPPRSQLFNGTVCPTKHNLHDFDGGRGYGSSMIPPAVSAAPPVIMRKIDPKTLTESKTRDVLVAINTGVVTAYAGHGEFQWQITGSPTWALDFKHATSALFDADATRVDDLGRHDSTHAQIFVLGDRAISLISRDGAVLSTSELPNKPVSRPIFGDFDSDGVSDVVVMTEDAILGFRLEVAQSNRGLLIALLVLAVVAAIIFFANIRTVDNHDAAVPVSKRHVLSISRATDEYHID